MLFSHRLTFPNRKRKMLLQQRPMPHSTLSEHFSPLRKKKNIRYCFGSGCGVRHLSDTLIFSQGLNISRGIIGGGGLTYPIPSSATPGSATDFQVTHEFLPRDFRTSRFGFMFSMFRQTPTSFPKKKMYHRIVDLYLQILT